MRAPWEPFDAEGSSVRGEVLYDLRADPEWLLSKLLSYLATMLVVSLMIMVGSGVHGLLARAIWGGITVLLGACYAAWWRRSVSGTRLRITTQEVVLESGRRGGTRISVADVRAITLFGGQSSFAQLVTVTVRRDSDGARRRATILLPRARELATEEAIEEALERAQAPLEGDERRLRR